MDGLDGPKDGHVFGLSLAQPIPRTRRACAVVVQPGLQGQHMHVGSLFKAWINIGTGFEDGDVDQCGDTL